MVNGSRAAKGIQRIKEGSCGVNRSEGGQKGHRGQGKSRGKQKDTRV